MVPTVFSAAGQLPGIPSVVGIAAVSACGWAGFVCGPPLIGQLASATSLPVALGVVPVLTAFIAVAVRAGLARLAPAAQARRQRHAWRSAAAVPRISPSQLHHRPMAVDSSSFLPVVDAPLQGLLAAIT